MLHQDEANKKGKIKTKGVDFEDGQKDEVEDAVQKVGNATGCSVSILPHKPCLTAGCSVSIPPPPATPHSWMLSQYLPPAMLHSRCCHARADLPEAQEYGELLIHFPCLLDFTHQCSESQGVCLIFPEFSFIKRIYL